MDKNSDKNTSFSPKRIFEFNGKIMDFTSPKVMGILNVTPDSFYDGNMEAWGHGGMEAGKQGSGEAGKRGSGEAGRLSEKVEQMVNEGAYIIDIGAVSTRPGAAEVNMEEEKKRLVPVLKEVRRAYPDIIISIDTFRAEIAKITAAEGADIINDISGGTFDPLMFSEIVHLNIPYIIMHIQGTPATMQLNPAYENVVNEVAGFLLGQAGKLRDSGHDKVILDPGFGFGKTVEHNYLLLQNLEGLVASDYPVLAGLSRKSMINRVLNIKPENALNGTTVLNTIALLKGASILRVHDVREAMEAVRLVEKMGLKFEI
jgi:dihydropteroate synthase